LAAAHERALSKLRDKFEAAKDKISGALTADTFGESDDPRKRARERGQESDRSYPPTKEQVQRGLRGELELKVRLQRHDGWEGFRLVEDRRADGCGYDFLCSDTSGGEAKLELKTFGPGGRVVLSLMEVHMALMSGPSYYLVGLTDDGGPAALWKAAILQDPAERLMSLGAFELEAVLEAPARAIFADRP
jgi:hypothetical protein